MQSVEQLAIQIEDLAATMEPSGSEAWREQRRLKTLYGQVPAEVVRDILNLCGFGRIPKTDNDVVLHAFALLLLRRLEVIDQDGCPQELVNAMLARARLPNSGEDANLSDGRKSWFSRWRKKV